MNQIRLLVFLSHVILSVKCQDQLPCDQILEVNQAVQTFQAKRSSVCNTVFKSTDEAKKVKLTFTKIAKRGTVFLFDGDSCLSPNYKVQSEDGSITAMQQTITTFYSFIQYIEQKFAFQVKAELGPAQATQFKPRECYEDLTSKPKQWITKNGIQDLCVWTIKSEKAKQINVTLTTFDDYGDSMEMWMFEGKDCTAPWEYWSLGLDGQSKTFVLNSSEVVILYRATMENNNLTFTYTTDVDGPIELPSTTTKSPGQQGGSTDNTPGVAAVITSATVTVIILCFTGLIHQMFH